MINMVGLRTQARTANILIIPFSEPGVNIMRWAHGVFKRDGPLSNNIHLVYQQLILGNYWFRAELLVINCWFVGICGLGINNGNVANGCFMGFGAHQCIV